MTAPRHRRHGARSGAGYTHARIVKVSPPVSRDRTTVPLVEPRYIVYKGIVVPCTLYTELTMASWCVR